MIGIVLLAHDQMHRTAQLAKHLTSQGCKVVVHIDGRVAGEDLARLQQLMGPGSPNIAFAPRVKCDWGTFSLVEASLGALRLMRARWPEVTHVCQLSGSCLPIKPIPELVSFLEIHADVDFIECVSVKEDPWVVDGLSEERFSLYHPLPWRKHRRAFDALVKAQRRLGIRRRMPEGLEPHVGSQWWCLSRRTVDDILDDPDLETYRQFFRLTWIPDESFFQTMAKKHSNRITGAPLTFVRFDPQGKPYVFYDDHLDLLLHAEGFFARKIWRGASQLYNVFLNPDLPQLLPEKSDGGRLTARFERAQKRHKSGRTGLVSQGRHPGRWQNGRFETARPYLVIDGLDLVFPDWREQLTGQPGVIAHGEIFHPERVEFAGGAEVFTGNLCASVAIRDHKPAHFLSKLIWIERAKAQVFAHDLTRAGAATELLLADQNAFLLRIKDRWVLDLYALWKADPGALAAAIGPARAAERAVAPALLQTEAKGRALCLTLEEVLPGGVAVSQKVAAALPEWLKPAAVFSGVRIPADFGTYLGALAGAGDAPEGINALRKAVERYNGMTRVLRRKT